MTSFDGRAEDPGNSTAEPGALLDRLLLVTSLLQADQARFHAEHDMTGARVHLLWQVGLTGPTSQRTVADALGVTPRAVTGLVDGLVESGHVSREPHPGDRRAALVTLTECRGSGPRRGCAVTVNLEPAAADIALDA